METCGLDEVFPPDDLGMYYSCILIDRIKTTSMEDVSTRVFEKIRTILIGFG